MSAMQRRKGGRLERAIIAWHRERGYKAERVPDSGASGYRNNKADCDCYVFGADVAPLILEVKGRKNGEGFKTIWNWMGTADGLALIANRQPPLFVLTEVAYERLLTAAKRAP